MSLKHCLKHVGRFEKHQCVVLNSSENFSYREWHLLIHCVCACVCVFGRDCHNVITDHTVSDIVVCVSCSYGALCGSCCYFEEFLVRLTTGCHSLLSLIFVPSLWTVWLQCCRWWKVQITLITVNLFRCLNEPYRTTKENLCLYTVCLWPDLNMAEMNLARQRS